MNEHVRATLASRKRYEVECRVRRDESAEALHALAKTAPERAALAWLALPAVHDDDGSIDPNTPVTAHKSR